MFGLGRKCKLGDEGKVGQKPRVGNWNVTKKDRIVKVSKMLSQIRGNKGSKKLIRYTVTRGEAKKKRNDGPKYEAASQGNTPQGGCISGKRSAGDQPWLSVFLQRGRCS